MVFKHTKETILELQACESVWNRKYFDIKRQRKQYSKLSDENIILLEIFKNPEKIRGI